VSLRFDRAAVKGLFKSGNGLFGLIHRFNNRPAAYAHPSWLDAWVPAELFRVLRRTRRGADRLSRMLLEQNGLCHDACYDFNPPQWRFALLPVEVIQDLTFYCGLAFQHRRIAGMVDKTVLSHLKESIGEQAYAFAVRRAPLLIGPKRGIDLQWDGSSDFGMFARRYGAVYFLSHFRDSSRAIAGRLAFKFSRVIAGTVVERPPESSGWQLFKRILIHEVDPRWQTLFS
jgi:hypothetical protein